MDITMANDDQMQRADTNVIDCIASDINRKMKTKLSIYVRYNYLNDLFCPFCSII